MDDLRDTLKFAADNEIKPVVEVYAMTSANEAVTRLRDNKARFRVVLKCQNVVYEALPPTEDKK